MGKTNSRSIKKTLVAVCLAMTAMTAFAANYYIVVPIPNRAAAATPRVTVSLSSYTLPAGTVGLPYTGFDLNSLLTVTGDRNYPGVGATWQVVSGSLPAGISLSSSGQLSGTPAAAGTHSFGLRATYKTQSGQQSYQIAVAALQVALASTTLPTGMAETSYTYDFKPLLTVTGDPSYTTSQVVFSLAGGNLPPGLSLSSDGVLSGTATAGVTAQPFTVRADYKNKSIDQAYTLTVTALPSDAYFNQVVLLASPEGSTYKDGSKYGETLTPGTGVSVDTAIAKFPGTSSMKFTGSSTGISVPYTAAKFDMTTNKVWTVEAWVYLQAPQSSVSAYRLDVAGNAASSAGWETGISPTSLTTTFPGYAGLASAAAISTGQWHHLVWQRNNSQFTFAQNGTVVGNATYSGGMWPNTVMRIGSNYNSSVGITYNIQELRITKGVERYPTTTGATYTVPTEPFPRK